MCHPNTVLLHSNAIHDYQKEQKRFASLRMIKKAFRTNLECQIMMERDPVAQR